MLLILAHENDSAARALADRWGREAMLLTVDQLHRAQWSLSVDRSGRARASVSLGTPVRVRGVVNRLGVITGADLSRVRREDRPYAAAELTAFLLAWLDACPAPVLNPPNPRCLNGPAWYPEEWADAAAAVGLRVAPVHRSVGLSPAAPVVEGGEAQRVHVVGDVCVGEVHPLVGRQLRALASLAGTPLLTATVSGLGARAEVREISAWPDVGDPTVADALAVALGRAAAGGRVAEVGESPGHVPEAPAAALGGLVGHPSAAALRGLVGRLPGGGPGRDAAGPAGRPPTVGSGGDSGREARAASRRAGGAAEVANDSFGTSEVPNESFAAPEPPGSAAPTGPAESAAAVRGGPTGGEVADPATAPDEPPACPPTAAQGGDPGREVRAASRRAGGAVEVANDSFGTSEVPNESFAAPPPPGSAAPTGPADSAAAVRGGPTGGEVADPAAAPDEPPAHPPTAVPGGGPRRDMAGAAASSGTGPEMQDSALNDSGMQAVAG
ncbi:hypothetical protein [Amycolatopsis solani]|uniref:hypothetical protein n=2 Tax=Amycolatopsis solani TaxID=3028615 RepID=UPI00296ED2DD|nr:hypothetical protein [Amycolatopsis sp. MEP2-6]